MSTCTQYKCTGADINIEILNNNFNYFHYNGCFFLLILLLNISLVTLLVYSSYITVDLWNENYIYLYFERIFVCVVPNIYFFTTWRWLQCSKLIVTIKYSNWNIILFTPCYWWIIYIMLQGRWLSGEMAILLGNFSWITLKI